MKNPPIQTFGYGHSIKNQVITESLIDDIQAKRANLFKDVDNIRKQRESLIKNPNDLQINQNNVISMKSTQANTNVRDNTKSEKKMSQPYTTTQSVNNEMRDS